MTQHVGIEVRLDEQHRDPEMEERFNVYIGRPYRVQQLYMVYDGILAGCTLHVCENGFVPAEVTLQNGLWYDARDPAEKLPFAEQSVQDRNDAHISAFGSILDQEGFQRAIARYRQ